MHDDQATFQHTLYAAATLDAYLRHRPIFANLALLDRDHGPCPMPRASQLVTTAGRTLPCDERATVLSAVPVVNRHTGERGFAPGHVCPRHSIDFAAAKLIDRIAEARRANPKRIVTLD